MKNLLMILSLITIMTINYSCKKNSDDCICTEIYAPVCGNDGVEYANQCKAECANVSFSEGVCSIEVNATILDRGTVALDGCDWVFQFEVDGVLKDHHVNDLPELYWQDQLEVKIEYKPTSEIFTCGLMATEMPIIELISVETL